MTNSQVGDSPGEGNASLSSVRTLRHFACSAHQIKEALAREYPAAFANKLEGKFDAIASELRASIPFRAMLAESEALSLANISKPANVV